MGRHAKDYADLSATPEQFKAFAEVVGQMQKTKPNYSARDMADIHVPSRSYKSEHDEFIKPEHAKYLARSIPGAELILLPGVSHFAPLQRPEQFNSVMLLSSTRSGSSPVSVSILQNSSSSRKIRFCMEILSRSW